MNYADLGYLRVAAASPMVTIGDPQANADTICSVINGLTQEATAIGVFPELCLTGYTAEDLFFSDALLHASRKALASVVQRNTLPICAVGLPWRLADGRLLNCAAIISGNRLMGMVPKSVQPNYGEFYDLRWFSPGADIAETIIDTELGQFQIRRDQLFELAGHRIGVEICEDLWSPQPPGIIASLAGADILINLSASNELIAKAHYRRDLIRMASASGICAYIYASAGAFESSKDTVFGGHCLVAENGQLIAESERFVLHNQQLVVDIDTARLAHDRVQNKSFTSAPRPTPYRINYNEHAIPELTELLREYSPHPFVPSDEHEFDARAQEILNIQATGLARRMKAARCEQLVIGLSGGLDSTLAFLVCLDALNKLGLAPAQLSALTMPGPGTTSRTHNNARRLTDAGQVMLEEIPIQAAVDQHLADLKHNGEHDLVFENAQARERTQILFNYANKVGGLVVGTGDLSELALGWCTFNADHMASYNVNASVPKTMMAYLVRWYATHRAEKALAEVLYDVLQTPISPELLPPKEGEISQHTESIVGPYELHDFFLFHYLRFGASPEKIFTLACRSFNGQYDRAEIKHWLQQFFQRFFSQQFKRTTLPPGPKVGSVSLSPRGDWRMPDEASAEQILASIAQL